MYDFKLTEFKFPSPMVIKTDTIINKSAGVILILFTASTKLSSLRKSAGKNSDRQQTFVWKFSK